MWHISHTWHGLFTWVPYSHITSGRGLSRGDLNTHIGNIYLDPCHLTYGNRFQTLCNMASFAVVCSEVQWSLSWYRRTCSHMYQDKGSGLQWGAVPDAVCRVLQVWCSVVQCGVVFCHELSAAMWHGVFVLIHMRTCSSIGTCSHLSWSIHHPGPWEYDPDTCANATCLYVTHIVVLQCVL